MRGPFFYGSQFFPVRILVSKLKVEVEMRAVAEMMFHRLTQRRARPNRNSHHRLLQFSAS